MIFDYETADAIFVAAQVMRRNEDAIITAVGNQNIYLKK